jgi:hypothetical protein
VFAGALFAFDGGDLDVWGGHVGLSDELAPGGADADELNRLGRVQFDERKAGDRIGAGGGSVDLGGGGHGSKRGSPPFSRIGYEGLKNLSTANTGVIGVEGKNMRETGIRGQGSGDQGIERQGEGKKQ